MFNKMKSYRPYHKLHHVTTGTAEDPDLLLTRGYPTSKKSMIRKFARDLFGITAIKSSFALLMMSLGYIKYTQAGVIERVKKEDRKINWMGLIGPVISNLVLFLLLTVLFDPRMYLIWLLAYFTTFQFCVRVRAMAEHSMVEDTEDPMRNTRTTKANFIERLLFAPYHVNYHLEHHMLMSVPSYNLPKMHKLLVERGFYEKGLLANGYWEIIKQAAQKK
jgi:fatty acid desaturase